MKKEKIFNGFLIINKEEYYSKNCNIFDYCDLEVYKSIKSAKESTWYDADEDIIIPFEIKIDSNPVHICDCEYCSVDCKQKESKSKITKIKY